MKVGVNMIKAVLFDLDGTLLDHAETDFIVNDLIELLVILEFKEGRACR
jgi:FMN phosphatase YigB (HAD superfamily)